MNSELDLQGGADLAAHINSWKNIAAPDVVLGWISRGVPIPFHNEPESFICNNRQMSFAESAFLDKEIKRLLDLQYIHKCCVHDKPLCIHPINCVSKRRGSTKFRLVTDTCMRRINQCIDTPSYKNEDIKVVAEIIKPHDYMISADICDGFFHIPVTGEFTKYLGFQWRGVVYKWLRCPFGLSCSPYYFAKTMRCVLAYLRLHD